MACSTRSYGRRCLPRPDSAKSGIRERIRLTSILLDVVDQPSLFVSMGFRFAREAKMFEMRVGFALGHVPPTAFAKQSLHETVDVGGPDLLCDLADFVEAFVVMFLDRRRTTLEILEGMTVGGQGQLDAADLADPIKRVEEGFQRIGEVGNAADVGRDRRQHVIPCQKCAGLWIVQADMVRRVTGRMEHEPFTAGEFDHIPMFDMMRDRGQELPSAEGREAEPSQSVADFGAFGTRLPGRRRRDALERTEEISHGILRMPSIALEQFHVDRQIVDGGLAVMIVGAVNVLARMALLVRGAAEMEGAVGHDLRAALLVDLYGTPEMIGMGVGDEDGVDVSWLEAGLFQAIHDRLPGRGSRKAGINHRRAVLVDQRVHVDMAEPGNRDRELHAQDILRDLADLFAGVLLFLSFGSTHRHLL